MTDSKAGAAGMNWAIVIIAFAVAAASVNYIVQARRMYVPLVSLVKQD